MSAADDVLIASIDELVLNFRSALVALVPMAERTKLTWADVMEQHPAWEKLQGCLFDVFVGQPTSADRNRISNELPLAPYDIDLEDYLSNSWIVCENNSGVKVIFVRFATGGEPFDTVQGVEIDAVTHKKGRRVEILLTDATFTYQRRTADGNSIRIRDMEAVE